MTRVQYVNWLLNQCVGQILEIVGVDTKTLGDLQNVLKGGNFEVHGPNGEIFKSSDLRDKCILVKAERCKHGAEGPGAFAPLFAFLYHFSFI